MNLNGLTTEHVRAWRAEALGMLLVLVGLLWRDVGFCAVGAGLVAVTTAFYSLARGAAARPPNVHAQPRV